VGKGAQGRKQIVISSGGRKAVQGNRENSERHYGDNIHLGKSRSETGWNGRERRGKKSGTLGHES